MSDILTCPRCNSIKFEHINCGPDSYEDDVTYTSDICELCGLYHSGWTDKWLLDCTSWQDEEYAQEYSQGRN